MVPGSSTIDKATEIWFSLQPVIEVEQVLSLPCYIQGDKVRDLELPQGPSGKPAEPHMDTVEMTPRDMPLLRSYAAGPGPWPRRKYYCVKQKNKWGHLVSMISVPITNDRDVLLW